MKKEILLILAVMSLGIWSCSSDDTTGGSSALNVTLPSGEVVGIAGGETKTIIVTANGQWTLTGTNDWCDAFPKSGGSGNTSVNITVSPRSESDPGCYSDRSVNLSIGNKSLTVIQKKIGALLLSKDKYPVPIEGETIEAEVMHNVDFNVIIRFDTRGWVKQVDGGTKALASSKLFFEVDPSDLTESRYGEIYIIDKSDDSRKDTIKVYQAQNDALILTDRFVNAPHTGNDALSVELRTNIEYDVIIPQDAGWIREVPAVRSMRVDNKTLVIDPFDDDDNRIAEVVFKDKMSDLADTLRICQTAENALIKTQTIYDIDHKYQQITIVLNDGLSYEVEIPEGARWISPVETGDEGILSYCIEVNGLGAERAGRIVIKDKNSTITDEISITQAANPGGPVMKGPRAMNVTRHTVQRNSSDAGGLQNSVLISWRYLPTDPVDISFDLYKKAGNSEEIKLNGAPLDKGTNYSDSPNFSVTNIYRLTLAGSDETIGEFTYTSEAATKNYTSIVLNTNVPNMSLTYAPGDAAVGDLDGDGQYEIIVKREVEGKDPSQDGVCPGSMLLEAYKFDGTFMWQIDMGPNIRQGAHTTQFVVYDFDGDGRDEIATRTSELTKFGDGYQIPGISYVNNAGRIVTGPEYLSVVEGVSGRELARTNYIARGEISDWWTPGRTDSGNRSDRFLMGVGHFDGIRPSIIICRGYYAKTVIEAWDFRGGGLTKRWNFTAIPGGANSAYTDKGNHNVAVGDVDGDGKDELVFGGFTLDDNGTPLYNNTNPNLPHGDALHLGKFMRNRTGLQIWSCFESGTVGAALRDARTGEIIWKYDNDGDVGRCIIGDFDPNNPGYEMSYGGNFVSTNGTDLGYGTGNYSPNMAIWWTGSLNRQHLDKTQVDIPNGGRVVTWWPYGISSINGTKANPSFYGDIFGDWREEVIFPSSDNKELRIFSTGYHCNYKFHPLMTDHIYRLGAAHQNICYNMPVHLGYYLGSDMFE